MKTPLIPIALVVFITQVQATSFDCSKSDKGVEGLICASKELSKADDALSDAYHKAHGALSFIGTEKEAKKAQKQLEKEEKDWWKKHLAKCPDVECLRAEYRARIATLRSYVRDDNPLADQSTPPSSSTERVVPDTITSAQQTNPQPEQQSTPPVRPEPLSETVTGEDHQSPLVSDLPTRAEPSLSEAATTVDQPPSVAPASNPQPMQTNTPPSASDVWSQIGPPLSWAKYALIFCYLLWGTYWGCQIIYPRMMAWYNSKQWFIFGKNPMEILMAEIAFGFQVRFYAVIIGVIVGCLGGAFYMQFFRARRSVTA